MISRLKLIDNEGFIAYAEFILPHFLFFWYCASEVFVISWNDDIILHVAVVTWSTYLPKSFDTAESSVCEEMKDDGQNFGVLSFSRDKFLPYVEAITSLSSITFKNDLTSWKHWL